jgi:hypothetical protein
MKRILSLYLIGLILICINLTLFSCTDSQKTQEQDINSTPNKAMFRADYQKTQPRRTTDGNRARAAESPAVRDPAYRSQVSWNEVSTVGSLQRHRDKQRRACHDSGAAINRRQADATIRAKGISSRCDRSDEWGLGRIELSCSSEPDQANLHHLTARIESAASGEGSESAHPPCLAV